VGDAVALDRRQRLAGSNFGTRSARPTRIEAFIATVWPKVWKSGAPEHHVAGVDHQRRAGDESPSFRRGLRWASSAPFGLPVVPEV